MGRLLRVRGSSSGAPSAAVDAVVRRLTSGAAQQQAQNCRLPRPGRRGPPGAADSGIREEAPAAVALDPADVRALLTRLASPSAPSRILAAFDVSTSMRAPVGDGTRVTFGRDAARSALTLVPGTSAIGLWDFACRLDGGTDHNELVPTRRLDADVEGRPQRDVLDDELDKVIGVALGPDADVEVLR